MQTKSSTDFSEYMLEKWGHRLPFDQFLDVRELSIPESLERARANMLMNYNTMFGNYIVVFGIFLAIFLVFHSILLIPFGISGVLIYLCMQTEGAEVQAFNRQWSRQHVYTVAALISIVLFLLRPWLFVSFVFTLAISMGVCAGHMALRKIKEAETEI